MKKLFFILLLLSLTGSVVAQSKWKNVTWKYRISFLPYGRSIMTGEMPATYFAKEYRKHVGSLLYETNFIELLYKPTEKTILFIRPQIIYSQQPYLTLEGERAATASDYAASKGESYAMLSGKVTGFTEANGGAFGIGRSYNLSPFSLEPFVGLEFLVWYPYSAEFLFKEKEKNYYFKESYLVKRPLQLGIMTGLKINLRLIGIWGLTLEPYYTFSSITSSYNYFYLDSKSVQQNTQFKERQFLSKFGLNLGTYFNIRKHRSSR